MLGIMESMMHVIDISQQNQSIDVEKLQILVSVV